MATTGSPQVTTVLSPNRWCLHQMDCCGQKTITHCCSLNREWTENPYNIICSSVSKTDKKTEIVSRKALKQQQQNTKQIMFFTILK